MTEKIVLHPTLLAPDNGRLVSGSVAERGSRKGEFEAFVRRIRRCGRARRWCDRQGGRLVRQGKRRCARFKLWMNGIRGVDACNNVGGDREKGFHSERALI